MQKYENRVEWQNFILAFLFLVKQNCKNGRFRVGTEWLQIKG